MFLFELCPEDVTNRILTPYLDNPCLVTPTPEGVRFLRQSTVDHVIMAHDPSLPSKPPLSFWNLPPTSAHFFSE